MEPQQQSTTPVDAADIRNSKLTVLADKTPSNDNPTGPTPGGQSEKVPIWMKVRPEERQSQEQKPPKLGKRMKYLMSMFESQPTEFQLKMHKEIQNACSKSTKENKENL